VHVILNIAKLAMAGKQIPKILIIANKNGSSKPIGAAMDDP
jgi:hypothetical protein